MTVTPTGPISVNMLSLRDVLAASATFRARLGVATATEALEKIILVWFQPNEPVDREELVKAQRPCAIIQQGSDFGFQSYSGGARVYLQPAGSFDLVLTDNDRFPDSLADSEIDFCNFVGGTLLDIAALSGVSSNIVIRMITTVQMPARNNPDNAKTDAGAYQMAAYRIHYGQSNQ